MARPLCGILAALERLAWDADAVTFSRRAVLIGISIGTLLTTPPILLSFPLESPFDGGYGLWFVWTALAVSISVATLALLCCGMRVTERSYVVTCAMWMPVIFVFDLHQASQLKDRAAPILVIVFDCLLVGSVRHGVVGCFLVVSLLWMLTVQFELLFRFGLLEVWGTALPSQRVEMMCDCAVPPCAASGTAAYGMAARGSTISLFVFFVDFYLTRRFSLQVQAEEMKMRATVAVAEVVAESLAQFDLEAAEGALQAEADRLPPPLLASFRALLRNLRSYRPFLPPSLLSPEDEEEDDVEAGSPASEPAGDDEVERRASSASFSFSGSELMHGVHDSPPPPSPVALPSPQMKRSSVNSRACGRPPRPALGRGQLKRRTATLLLVTCDLAPGAVRPDLAAYAAAHGEYLSDVMEHVKGARGLLTYFNGDRVYASFNAFRRASQHASGALDAAQLCAAACQKAGRAPARAAVATGAVLVGTLGNAEVVAPSILGPAAWWLDQMCAVGRALGEAVVCTGATAADVSLMYELRMLLHKCVLAAPDTRQGVLSHTADKAVAGCAAGVALYALMGGTAKQDNSPGEWIYEMENAAGKKWETYNDAGKRWHRDGDAAAVGWLEEAGGAGGDAVHAFREGVREAQTFDFTLGTGGAAAEDGGGGGDDDVVAV